MEATMLRSVCLLALQVLLFSQSAVPADGTTVGVVYGYDGNNLPLPSQVVQLLTNNFMTQVRIYDTNEDILKAFVGSSIQVIVGIPNSQLPVVGASNATAASWLTSNVVPYATAVNISAIAVGNEVLTAFSDFTPYLVQTMTWIHDALVASGLDSRIRVSTPVSTGVLQSSFPPSQSVFNQTMLPTLVSLLQFLNYTGSYIMVNIHTFDVFQANSAAWSLDYALFEAQDKPVKDAYSNLNYTSLFDSLVDATYTAMNVVGFSNLLIVVSETGWPSLGDSSENGANSSNAQKYNENLALQVKNGTGTPASPRVPVNAYIYALFNENQKNGSTSERNFGLFNYNLSPVYNVDLTGQGRLLTSNGTQYQTWCVAITGANDPDLQNALDWACGEGGVNCSATNSGGECFNPNTLLSHASWVFNQYYQQNGNAPGTCDFTGVAQIVSYDPSSGSCIFQASNVSIAVNGSSVPPTSPNMAPTLSLQLGKALTIICLTFLFVSNVKYLLV